MATKLLPQLIEDTDTRMKGMRLTPDEEAYVNNFQIDKVELDRKILDDLETYCSAEEFKMLVLGVRDYVLFGQDLDLSNATDRGMQIMWKEMKELAYASATRKRCNILNSRMSEIEKQRKGKKPPE